VRKGGGFNRAKYFRYLSLLEHGRSSPTLDKLQDLSEALGVSPLVLLGAATAIKEGVPVDELIDEFAAQMRPFEADGILNAARSELMGRSCLVVQPAESSIEH